MGFSTAKEYHIQRSELIYITTGSKQLDDLRLVLFDMVVYWLLFSRYHVFHVYVYVD